MKLSIYLKSIVLAGLLVASSAAVAQSSYLYNGSNGDYYQMTGNYPQYSYLGYLSTGYYGSFNDFEEYQEIGLIEEGPYFINLNWETYEYAVSAPSCGDVINANLPIEISYQNSIEGGCPNYSLSADWPFENFNFQWYRNGQAIPGANENTYSHPSLLTGNSNYTLQATCPGAGALTSNTVAIDGPGCYSDDSSPLDYMLVQNVTTTGNVPGQSIQVQFDLSWGNTWKDDINWDAAWVFMKYKNALGEWKHAKLSPTGHDNGQGTPNVIEPTSDQMGAFIRLAQEGQGNFNAEGLQLRWNYSTEGLASVSGLEIRVFAIEMVYHPQGDFSMSWDASAPGGKTPVINNRLSPLLYVNGVTGARIKGDAGIDMDGNGVIDNTTYPTGYYPFYLFKYEVSEQQYADFYNCLTTAQRGTLGLAGNFITENAGQFYTSRPNAVCTGANQDRLLAYADWCGLRPMSFLEMQKAYNGPKVPNTQNINTYYPYNECAWFHPVPDVTTIPQVGAGVYGCKGLSGKSREPYIPFSSSGFDRLIHGNGALSNTGLTNESNWLSQNVSWTRLFELDENCSYGFGFRLCRSAE